MASVLERFAEVGIVPVVVIEDVKDAVPTAQAMVAGGVPIMEVTLRTAAGLDSIRKIHEACPEVLLGAGTVLNLEQCKQVLEAGAKFIVTPGYDEEIVSYCVENNIPITPGCVTPTEIMKALSHGLTTIKFFPANVYGGLTAMKALSAPFVGIKFLPTGGVNAKNLDEYISAPFIDAIGGSWVCTQSDISDGNLDKITQLCKEARDIIDANK